MKSTREEIRQLEQALSDYKMFKKSLNIRVKNFDSMMAEQDAIIAEAENRKLEIQEAFYKAPDELKKLEKLEKFKKKRLTYLRNLKLIDRLKTTVTELTQLSKEVQSEKHIDS